MDDHGRELLRQLEELVSGLSPDDRLELIGHLTWTAQESLPRDKAEEQTVLREAQEALTVRHEFRPGELVEWKTTLRNRQLPEYGQAAIVLETLAEPVLDEGEPSDSPYYREPLDIVLGTIDGDGDLAAFHFDSRRFQPVVSKHFTL